MPNLVGIGNSQVPTNAMLGGLAYQDSVGEINIESIKAKTPDSPVDIFVYDTSKDSDGGAWRKKATKQSWYNEGVSQTRGARKEFPAVAVIVVEGGEVLIYDGDDPNLPLWMEFDVAIPKILYTNATCAHMLNGVLVVGTNPNATNNDYWDGGIKVFNFITDKIRSYSGTRSMIYRNNISQRNETRTSYYDTTNVLVSPNVSAVTMFLLPNAPIDEYTGLPIPTILAATRRGISAVRDDGAVYDMLVSVGGGSNYQTNSIEITKDLKIIHNWDDRASNAYSSISIIPLSLLESDSSYGYEYQFRNEGVYGYNVGGGSLDIFNAIATYFVDAVPTELGYFAIGSNKGLVNIQHIPQALNNGGRSSLGDARFNGGMHCRITNNFNTGWMYDNIKGAFLSDTSTTNITGSELVTNGTFASNISGWSGAAQFSHSTNNVGGNTGGKLMVYHTASTNIYISQTITTVAGKYYTISYLACSDEPNKARIWIGGTYYDYIVDNNNAALVVHSHTFYASGTSTEIRLYNNGASRSYWDNVSVRITEEDRSVRGKGLQVYGTITKSVVATGAELVAYSGFTSSNYLFQPHNTDFEFGTDDYSVMLWYKGTSSSTGSREIFANLRGSTNHWVLSKEYTNKFVFDTVTDPNTYAEGVWNHVAGVRRSGIAYLYVNGELVGSAAANDNITDTSDGLFIGHNPDNNDWRTRGFLALLRISASAPTKEQIKKIYNDEKCLFNENSKCTLHGTSDDIKAISFDDTDDILHVGTSSGRSEFQGLNRINNTTTAVTTAISASNGLVAEQ